MSAKGKQDSVREAGIETLGFASCVPLSWSWLTFLFPETFHSHQRISGSPPSLVQTKGSRPGDGSVGKELGREAQRPKFHPYYVTKCLAHWPTES